MKTATKKLKNYIPFKELEEEMKKFAKKHDLWYEEVFVTYEDDHIVLVAGVK